MSTTAHIYRPSNLAEHQPKPAGWIGSINLHGANVISRDALTSGFHE
jgi:hypothetical protein